MNAGVIIAIVTLAVTAPPALVATWLAIKKDRIEAADRLANRLRLEREAGRLEAQTAQRISDLEEQIRNDGSGSD